MQQLGGWYPYRFLYPAASGGFGGFDDGSSGMQHRQAGCGIARGHRMEDG
jgi:hypothetical protein